MTSANPRTFLMTSPPLMVVTNTGRDIGQVPCRVWVTRRMNTLRRTGALTRERAARHFVTVWRCGRVLLRNERGPDPILAAKGAPLLVRATPPVWHPGCESIRGLPAPLGGCDEGVARNGSGIGADYLGRPGVRRRESA